MYLVLYQKGGNEAEGVVNSSPSSWWDSSMLVAASILVYTCALSI